MHVFIDLLAWCMDSAQSSSPWRSIASISQVLVEERVRLYRKNTSFCLEHTRQWQWSLRDRKRPIWLLVIDGCMFQMVLCGFQFSQFSSASCPSFDTDQLSCDFRLSTPPKKQPNWAHLPVSIIVQGSISILHNCNSASFLVVLLLYSNLTHLLLIIITVVIIFWLTLLLI